MITSLILSLVLLFLSAMFSGLTLGLMSLSVFELKRKSELGMTEAKMVYPIRARGNELLVTLLVGNVLVNAALTVVLDDSIPGDTPVSAAITVIVATILITFFGEILPQAFLKKHGLKVGAAMAPYITFVLNVMRPISAPLGRMIDKTVGVETPDIYTTAELIKIFEEHEESEESDVVHDELTIVRNALKFGDKLVKDVMTPKSMIVAMEEDESFTTGALKRLQDSGHSRFPVFKKDVNNVVGLLYIRDLIASNKQKLTAGEAADREVKFVNENQMLDHVLNGFIKTKKHLFIVVNEFGETTGIITIEDIIEEIIGKEIVDEFDKYDDLREVARLRAKKRAKKISKII